jgi:hypothetical protein
MRLHYLSMPLLARVGGGLGTSPITVYALLGPRVDLLVEHGTETSSSFDLFYDGAVAGDLADRYDETTLGASGGIGVAIELGEMDLTVEVLQHRDLTPPVDRGGASLFAYTLDPLRNLATAVSVGIER